MTAATPPLSVRRQVLRGSAYLTAEQGLTLSLSLLYSILLFRYLGPHSFGGFSLMLAVLAISQLLAGTYESYLERFVPAQVESGTAGAVRQSLIVVWLVKVVSAVVIAILLWELAAGIATVVGFAPLGEWLRSLCWTVPANACIDVTIGFAFGLKRFGIRLFVSGLRNVLKVASVAVCFAGGRSVEAFVVLLTVQSVLVAVVALGVNAILLRRLPRQRSATRWADAARGIVRYSTPIAAGNFVFSLHEYSGKLILGPFFPPEVIGYFSYAMDTVSRLVALVRGLSTVLLPVMAEALARKDTAALERTVEGGFRYLTAVGAVMSVATIALAPEVTRVLAGSAFAPATLLLGAMGLQLVFRLPAQALTMGLYAHECTGTVLRLTVERYLLMLALYAVLLPVLGIVGACWADVLSFFGMFFRFTAAAQAHIGVGAGLRRVYLRTVLLAALLALPAWPLWGAGSAGLMLRALWVPVAALVVVVFAGLVRDADVRRMSTRLALPGFASGVLFRLAAISVRLGGR